MFFLSFCYILSGGKIYYEYYGKNIQHRDCTRYVFINAICQLKSLKRDRIISDILS